MPTRRPAPQLPAVPGPAVAPVVPADGAARASPIAPVVPAGPLVPSPPHAPTGEPRYGDGLMPLAIAHRGGAGLAPENTLAAFGRAYALGLRYLETDVRTTADGVCVLFHDARTVRVTGVRGRIAEQPWSAVRRLLVHGREPIPRLEDVLDAFPDARLAIDLKDPRGIDRVADVLRGRRAADRVCLAGTGDAWLAAAARELRHPVARAMGWQSTARLVAAARFGHRPRGVVPAPFVHVPLRLYGCPVFADRLTTMAAELGARVVVWTVNRAAVMHRLLDAGVAGIVTDRPDLLRDVLLARGSWSPPPALPGDPPRDRPSARS